MVPQKDPLGILGEQPKEKKQADPLGILKKKEVSEPVLEIGGEAGISEPPLRKEKVLDYLTSLKEQRPIEIKGKPLLPVQRPKKVDTNFGLTKEKAQVDISPKVEEISISADPIGEARKRASESKNLQESQDYLTAADIFTQLSVPSGYDAYVRASSPLINKENATGQILLKRAGEYAAATEGLRQIKAPDLSTANEAYIETNVLPQIERAAVLYKIKANPSFKKELDAVGTSADDPKIANVLGSAKMGAIMDEFLNLPDVASFSKDENPNLAIALQYAKDRNLDKNTEFGISSVANKVSREFERSEKRRNPFGAFATDQLKKDLDEVAQEKLTPQEYNIYQNYIKGKEEQYLDTPSFLTGFAEEGKKVYQGFLNTIDKISGQPERDAIREQWRKEASNVSANPEGWRNFVSEGGKMSGLVGALAGTGNVLTGVAGLGAVAETKKVAESFAEAVNIGTAFWGDMVDQGIMKYPNSPVKAYTSAGFNTLMFLAIGKSIFPAKKVESAFKAIQPEVEQVVKNLTNGSISREAARQRLNTIAKKGIGIASEGAVQNAKVAGELTGLGVLNEGLDVIMDMDEDKIRKYYPEGVHGDTFKSMFLGNTLVSAVAGYGKYKVKNNIAKEAIYEAATNPKRYERIINELSIKDPNISKQELLDNLSFAVETKRLLDQRGVSEKKQKEYILKALGERVATIEKEKIADTTLKKEQEEKIKQAQAEKETILTSPEEEEKPIVPITEEGTVPQVPVAPEKIEPIRQLGTGANVYFENEKYRVNDFKDKVLVNVQGTGDTGVIANLEFDTPEEAVDVAKTLNKLYPQGVPEAVLLDKVVEDIKAGKYKEVVGEVAAEEAPQVPATEMKPLTLEVKKPEGFVPSLLKLGYTADEISKMTLEQQQDIVINKTEPARAETTAKLPTTEAAPELPVEEELPFGETAPREEKKQREITNKTKRALSVEITDNPRGEVLQYFLAGGKVSPESMEELFGRKKQGYRWTGDEGKIKEEKKLRRSLIEKNAPAIEALAEKIAGTDRLDRVQEYRNAIEEVLLDHNRRETMADELVEDFDFEYNAMLKQREIEEIGDDVNNQIKDFVSGLPPAQKREIENVLDTFRKEDGTIDWDTIEKEIGIIDPFSEPIIQNLSEQSQKILKDGIQQFKEAGRVSRFRGEVVLSPEEIRAGDAARRLAEKIRAGKISKEGFRASTGFDVVFDAALEVIATSLEAGASIADAIESGLKYIKGTEYYKNLTDKKEFENKFTNRLNEEYNAIQESTAGEVPIQPEAGVGEEVEAGVPPTKPQKPAKEGEVEGETAAEKKSVELSLKGINEIANEFSLDPVEGRPRKSDVDLREEAKNQIDKWVAEGSYDKNIENLIKRAENLEVLNDKDRVILEQHLASVRQKFTDAINDGTIKAGTQEFNQGLQYLKRLIDAGAKTRSAAGAALRIPNGGSVAHPLENYDTALVAKMEANGVDELTAEQVKEVEESVKKYKEKLDVANQKIKDLEDKLSQMMAESEVASTRKKRVVKSREERISERRQAISDAREALKKLRTGEAGLSAVPLPYVREFIAISPYVKKVMQSYVEEGIDNLNVLIDKIYDDFKGDIPEMTKKDIRDIIGNQYTKRKETKSELQSAIKDLTEEAKLLSIYEKLLAGEEPASPKKKIERNRKIKDLRDKINELRKKNKEADVDYTDLKRIEDTKKRALAKAEEYKKRTQEGDFAPTEKPVSIFNDINLQKKYPKEYGEMLDAIQERDDAKHEFDIALLKDEEKNQTKVQKLGGFFKTITGTVKALRSGIDASATLIQNFATLSAYPSSFFKAFINQWGDFASQKRFNRWHTELKNNKPVWDLIQNSGLSITEPSALKEAQKEEIFSNNLLDRTFKVGDKTYNIGKYTTKPFERLFVSMGNVLRVDVFLKTAEKWYSEGKTFENSPEDFKSLANMLNNMTSRAKLAPAVERARDIIGTGIWSPQLMASRLNLLGISDVAMPFFGRKGYYAGLTPEVRKMQIANTAKMIGFGLSIMSLAAVSGADDVDFDPASPTFGTIKIGDKRIPVFSNFTKYVRTIVQFALGKQKIEGEYKDKRRGETVLKFFRSSAPPATGTAWDIITGKDYMGKPVTAQGVVKGLLYPMSIEAIAKDVKRDGALGVASGIGQFFGLNISDERDYVKKDDKPFEVKDPSTFKKRETTPKELEAFKKTRDEIYKEISSEYEKNYETLYLTQEGKIKLSRGSSISDEEFDKWKELYYRDLNKEQVKELYKLLMSKAKKEAKKELNLESVEEEKED